jgi:hypothetical protein
MLGTGKCRRVPEVLAIACVIACGLVVTLSAGEPAPTPDTPARQLVDWDSWTLVLLAAIGFLSLIFLMAGTLAQAFFGGLKMVLSSHYEFLEWRRNERRTRGLDQAQVPPNKPIAINQPVAVSVPTAGRAS